MINIYLLNRLEFLARESSYFETCINIINSTGVNEGYLDLEKLRELRGKTNNEIRVLKEFILNEKLQNLFKIKTEENLTDLRFFDVRVRSTSYCISEETKWFITSYRFLMYIFFDDVDTPDINLKFCQRVSKKIKERMGGDFDSFIDYLNMFNEECKVLG